MSTQAQVSMSLACSYRDIVQRLRKHTTNFSFPSMQTPCSTPPASSCLEEFSFGREVREGKAPQGSSSWTVWGLLGYFPSDQTYQIFFSIREFRKCLNSAQILV